MSKTTAILRHIHLPNITPFRHAQEIQQSLVKQFLSRKALVSSPSRSPAEAPLPPAPSPTILTFTPTPVYTLGRREHGSLSEQQKDLLRAGFRSGNSESEHHGDQALQYAEIVETQRGGQTTFHGPNQLVIYPILDLKPSSSSYPAFPKGLSVRCYVNLLEQATINTLARWNIEGIRTENPGVWEKRSDGDQGIEKKIAALGVHLRRNVTSYGVAVNVKTDLAWFERIVACGLEGKGVTSMLEILSLRRRQESVKMMGSMADPETGPVGMSGGGLNELGIENVAQNWVEAFVSLLWKDLGSVDIQIQSFADLVGTDRGAVS